MQKIVTLCLLVICTSLTGCFSMKQVGSINMISTRNVESQAQYVLLKSYAGGSKRELKRSRATSIQQAIDETVKAVPGGEFMKNVKIYLIKGKYFAVEGDVWGISGEVSYRGFKVGDKVTWKSKKGIIDKVAGDGESIKTGVITSLKDDKTCFVKVDGTGDTVELSYDDISKSQ